MPRPHETHPSAPAMVRKSRKHTGCMTTMFGDVLYNEALLVNRVTRGRANRFATARGTPNDSLKR
eukprot:443149-Rhodomonas_salina.1